MFVEKHPELRVRVVHGNTLTAGVILNSIPQGTPRGFPHGGHFQAREGHRALPRQQGSPCIGQYAVHSLTMSLSVLYCTVYSTYKLPYPHCMVVIVVVLVLMLAPVCERKRREGNNEGGFRWVRKGFVMCKKVIPSTDPLKKRK